MARRGRSQRADEFSVRLAGALVVERDRDAARSVQRRAQQCLDVEGAEHPAHHRGPALRRRGEGGAAPVRGGFDDQRCDPSGRGRVGRELAAVGDRLGELGARGPVLAVGADERRRVTPVALQRERQFGAVSNVGAPAGEQAVVSATGCGDWFDVTSDEFAERRVGVAPRLEGGEP